MKLKICRNDVKSKISEDMFGLFFEDINYGLDGGLHAEMLENRNFEATITHGYYEEGSHYENTFDGGYGWYLYEGKEYGANIYCDCQEPLNQVNPHYLVFEGKGSRSSFTNKAYDGLYLKKGMSYHVSFYAKCLEGDSDVRISLMKNGVVLAEKHIEIDNTGWKKYSCVLESYENTNAADFVVGMTKTGKMAFDQFSMMPGDAVCGVFRKDLVELLADLKPSFIRFPGGCVIEGNLLENSYRWKLSIGPVEERKYNWNRWALHNAKKGTGYTSAYGHYGQTLGIGYYEYFLLCEYLGAKALPVMNVGLACQYMSSQQAAIGSPEMEEYIQDALDLIEFANGSVDTEWGRKRAKMGHPEPFHLIYLGIGNEQWQTETVDFYSRYQIFEKRIHEKYPDIQLIGSSGPDVWSKEYSSAWKYYRKEAQKNRNFTYAVDEHYYVRPEWLYQNTHFYDHYDRDVKVFAGEYACHIANKAGKMNCPEANTMEAALAEAAFMTGIERNADVVVMASYAPLFARLGYTQWSPDLIWFNGEKAYCTPSYYVQQMYSCNRGIRTLQTDWDEQKEAKERIYVSAVETQEGDIILKVVNASPEEKCFELDGTSMENLMDTVQITELSGAPELYNDIDHPQQVAPRTYTSSGDVVLKAHSFSVLHIFKRK